MNEKRKQVIIIDIQTRTFKGITIKRWGKTLKKIVIRTKTNKYVNTNGPSIINTQRNLVQEIFVSNQLVLRITYWKCKVKTTYILKITSFSVVLCYPIRILDEMQTLWHNGTSHFVNKAHTVTSPVALF